MGIDVFSRTQKRLINEISWKGWPSFKETGPFYTGGINLINDKYKYIIQIFEKSGCSTLKNLFLKIHFDEFSEHDKSIITSLGDGAFHHNKYEYISRDDNILNRNWRAKNYYKFSVVRNSYERVVSMYFNRYLGIGPDGCFALGGGPFSGRIVTTNFEGLRVPEIGPNSFNYFLLNEIPLGNDVHFNRQCPNKNINTYLYLNEVNETLPNIYKDVIKIGNDKLILIKELIQEKLEYLRKKRYKISHKLDDYNFKEDKLNLNIMKNGVPQKNLMITEENAQIIKEKYKEEIEYHGFDYKHLL